MRFIFDDGTDQHSFDIQPGVTVIGRGSDCDVQLNSQRVSRKHTEIMREGSQVMIRDMGSVNGTIVNGSRISGGVVLNDGDQVVIGDVKLRLDAAGAQAAAAPGFAEQNPEYSEDEVTPPDGTFVPEVYRPEGPPQPIITQRDGRWFLRDPQTQREIEIVPKDGAASDPDKNKRLTTYGVIGGAVLVAALLLSIAISSATHKDIPIEPAHKVTRSQYNSGLETAIRQFEDDKLTDATQTAKRVDVAWPDLKVAHSLQLLFEAYQDAGEDISKIDYAKVRLLLKDIQNRAPTTAVSSFASSQLEKVDRMQRALSTVARANTSEVKGDVVKAYEIMNSLPADNPVRTANKDYIDKLQSACYAQFTEQAELAQTAGEWDAAIEAYEQAKKYATSPLSRAEIQKELADCATGKREHDLLTQAEEHYKKKEYAQAATLVNQIGERSFYAEKVSTLKKQIQESTDRDTALSFYATGRAQEAIDLIRTKNIRSLNSLIDKATAVLKAYNEAQEADEKAGSQSEAIAAYQRVLDLEEDEDNYYHRIAKKRKEELLADVKGRAEEYLLKGNKAFDDKQVETARRYWEMATAIDGTSGKASLEMLDKAARDFYLKGIAKKTQGNDKEAKDLLTKAMRYAKVGSDYYNRARKALLSE